MPTKRARGDTFAIDLALAESAKKYEALSPSKPSLRLFGEGDASFEIGYVNPKSDVVFAKFDGKLYVGHNYWNPASYDATGECIEESAVGVTLMNLLSYYANPAYRSFIPLVPREKWTAFVKAAPVENTALFLQVVFRSPFEAVVESGFYGIELEMYEFLE